MNRLQEDRLEEWTYLDSIQQRQFKAGYVDSMEDNAIMPGTDQSGSEDNSWPYRAGYAYGCRRKAEKKAGL